MNTMFAIGTYPLPPTIERFGRRRIMFWSAFVLALLMTVFVALIGVPHQTRSIQWTAAIVICLWNMVFGYGWVGVPWLYGPEVCILPLSFLSFLSVLPLARILTRVDRAPQTPTCWWCGWRIRRVAFQLHYSVRWRHCASEYRLENLDLDAA